jgi:transcriptional regulator GlxA family with amidase domain
MDRRIIFLKKQMLADLQSQASVEEMAKSVNLSVSHLLKLFKSEVGISPVQYLRNLRLEKARILLENSFKRVNEIGFEVGITDQSHFLPRFQTKIWRNTVRISQTTLGENPS